MIKEDNDKSDNINYKAVCCEQIPELFLDKLVAKQHFSKFGKISRFILRPMRLSCTVEYETADEAEHAYLQAGHFNGRDFTVNYAERDGGHVAPSDEMIDPDVLSELQAMNSWVGGSMLARPFQSPPYLTKDTRLAVARSSKSTSYIPSSNSSKPSKVTSTEATFVDLGLRNELEAILRRAALTNEDKYRVLEARDKLIRLTTVRQTNIQTAVSTKGTCPDMCPEKERLMRDFQRQVANFEMSDGSETDTSISHRRAVKEYSRSSADQEVPLSHELRPENVLDMTMLYLMHNIMDLCDDPDVSLCDWFHFVWDRTRSIRKDITQQELCSLGAVRLVEQCARFHIHCAARLVSEDPSVFDKKINAENLTKCLQSLKYMYHDLRIKNVPCPCEAEFRSYIVLLNLGDSNFLWELKQLPEHIQNSVDIKRSIQFYNALHNNNYVRFFKLVSAPATSYLSAAILLGYFNKLRMRALDTIHKAHLWRKNDGLPLDYLTRVLGFEDVESAVDFFEYYGLVCDGERVMLDRLKKPDGEYTMNRAMMLVESKRTVSVGECVYGQALDSVEILEQHSPHNSFDENGVLKEDAWNADDQLRGEEAVARAAEKEKEQDQEQKLLASLATDELPLTNDESDVITFKVPQLSPSQSSKSSMPSIFGSGLPYLQPSAPPFSLQNASGSLSIFASDRLAAESTDTDAAAAQQPFNIDFIFKTDANQAASVPPASSVSFASSGDSIFRVAAQETAGFFGTAQTLPVLSDFFAKPKSHKITEIPLVKSSFGSSGDGSAEAKSPKRLLNGMGLAELQEQQRLHELRKQQRERDQLEAERQQRADEDRRQVCRLADAERARQHHLETLQLRSKRATKQELQALVHVLVTHLAAEELRKFKRLDVKVAQMERHIDFLIDELIVDIVEEVQTEVMHDRLLLRRYCLRWLQHTRQQTERRRLMLAMPLWTTTETRDEQAAQVSHPGKGSNLKLMKRYRHGAPCDFEGLLAAGDTALDKPVVDIFRIVAEQASHEVAAEPRRGMLTRRKYFKLVLTVPGELDELHGFESLCSTWLEEQLPPPQVARAPDSEDAYICAVKSEVAVCVRKLSGVPPRNETGERLSNEADNADGVVCLMSCLHLQNTRKRLHSLLTIASIERSVPLAIIVYDCQFDEMQLADILDLDNLRAEGHVSTHCFFGCREPKADFRFDVSLEAALCFVARESSAARMEAQSMEMTPLLHFLEAQLGEELWQRWFVSAHNNLPFQLICSDPLHVIAIYNTALEHLQSVIDDDFGETPEFPAELRPFVPKQHFKGVLGIEHFPVDWKQPKRQLAMIKFLQGLRLPQWHGRMPKTADQYNIWAMEYAALCFRPNVELAEEMGYQTVRAIINQLSHNVELDEETALKSVNYLVVLKPLVMAHINNVLKTYGGHMPKEVIYRRSALRAFAEQPWWLNCETVDEYTDDLSLIGAELPDAAAAFSERSPCTLDPKTVIEEAEALLNRVSENMEEPVRTNPRPKRKAPRDDAESDEELQRAKAALAYAQSVIDDNWIEETFKEELKEIDANDDSTLYPQYGKKRKLAEDSSEVDVTVDRACELIERLDKEEDEQQDLYQTLGLK